jgi:hypothetical protein
LKRPAIPRSLSGPSRTVMKRHARQTGEVTWAWNLLHAGFFHIFSALVSPSNKKLASAVWHSIQSDKAQREMALASAEAILAPGTRVLANIKWLKQKADLLSPFRNDAAHVLITMGLNERMKFQLWPDPNTSRPAAVERLLRLPVASYWRKVRGDLFSLGVYAAMHADFLRSSSSRLPPRPRLSSVQLRGAPTKKRRGPRRRPGAS